MKTISAATKNAWLSGDYTGENRAFMRATVGALHQLHVPYKHQVYRSCLFGQHSKPVELPNIKSIRWSRSIDTDTAECTIVLYNTEPLPLGHTPATDGDFDLPGFYTYNRGKTSWSTSRWGQTSNGWQGRLVPDRIIKTYEGYGFDPSLAPEVDPHMYPSGVWKIDDVQYTHDGLITLQCRDLASVLMDEIMFVPVVPLKEYPLKFWYHTVDNPDTYTTSGTTRWIHPAYSSDSGIPYYGVDGNVSGHHPDDAFDGSTSSYWLSVGNDDPNAGYAYEYVQGAVNHKTISAFKFKVWGGPYRVYLSVFANGAWRGDQVVPYDTSPPASPNGANIRFVHAMSADHNATVIHKFANAYDNVTKVRLTFHHLYNSGIGPYPYRAGLKDFQVLSGTSVTTSHDGGTSVDANYTDYTDIVKLLLAYGGFFWPRDSTRGRYRRTDGTYEVNPAPANDAYLHKGMIWGDVQPAYTHGVADLGVDIWDKKPLIDGINYVKDILGFIFHVDEFGGAVWRMPNLWSVGNFINNGGQSSGRSSTITHIDERTTLIGLTATLSSRNVRERVFVANVNGRFGAVTHGFNPYPSGLRRVGGWTDQNFQTKRECQIMADMIVVRQMFTYRTDSVTIAGYPGIQIDDQVKIFERVTNEGWLHYVKGIECNWDIEDGKWTYKLDTHWLGETPFKKWVVDPSTLSAETQAYLHSLGAI